MSLLRTSRLSEHLSGDLTKSAVVGIVTGLAGLMGKGLWGGAKAMGSSVKRFGLFPTAGMIAGPVAAGAGVNEAMKGAKEDMSAQGFAQRMGYGG